MTLVDALPQLLLGVATGVAVGLLLGFVGATRRRDETLTALNAAVTQLREQQSAQQVLASAITDELRRRIIALETTVHGFNLDGAPVRQSGGG